MYCEKCGALKQNGVCPKCDNQKDSSWIVFTVLKCIFIPLGVGGLLFFVTTLVSVFLNMYTYANGTEVPAVLSKGILPLLQIGLPILIIMFGWVVILIIDILRHRNK